MANLTFICLNVTQSFVIGFQQCRIFKLAKSKVISNTQLSELTFLLRVERPNVNIMSGQCFNIGNIGTGVNREYSMCSSSKDDFIEFLIRKVEDGVVSPFLAELNRGDTVELFGPYGEFNLEKCDPYNAEGFVFIATGTGIAPFRSFTKSFPNLKYDIIHGIRLETEQYFAEEFGKNNYHPCISRPNGSREKVYVTDYLKQNPIAKNKNVFICGNRLMIADVFDLCREMGICGDNIYTEVFF